MKDVKGKVAVVTGAASGIGRGMVESFAAAGMKVVLSDIEGPALARATEVLRDAGADVHSVLTDVSKPDQVEALAAETLRKYGVVHVVCNNAGVSAGSWPGWITSLDDWHWVLGVNLTGVFHGVRTFLPIMIERRMNNVLTGANPTIRPMPESLAKKLADLPVERRQLHA